MYYLIVDRVNLSTAQILRGRKVQFALSLASLESRVNLFQILVRIGFDENLFRSFSTGIPVLESPAIHDSAHALVNFYYVC